MAKVTRKFNVKRKPEAVIDYIADVENHPAFIPPLKSVANIAGDPKRKGTNWDWTFVMAGVEINGKAETADYQAGKRYSFKTTGIDSTFIYTVEPADGGSQVTADVAYEVPQGVLAKIADKAVVERMNERDADRAAQSLKTILDS
ncbi:MAG: SRPBCC family protein [Candidatus Dormibacteraeota bacterium]|nr:SRPBCC family protein [Candidatus Dormibacteraeota bacterium]